MLASPATVTEAVLGSTLKIRTLRILRRHPTREFTVGEPAPGGRARDGGGGGGLDAPPAPPGPPAWPGGGAAPGRSERATWAWARSSTTSRLTMSSAAGASAGR